MKSPYTGLPSRNFWRSGVSESHPLTVDDLYHKKFDIAEDDKIAAAGSCFAQHVSTYLKKNGFSVLDIEPAPAALSEAVARKFGYGIYSARYGNIYTVRQLLQLAQDAESGTVREADVWTKDGRYYDALRPNIEEDGFDSIEETLALRKHHLAKVKELFEQMDVFIFTLGLTEAWIEKSTGRVYPTAPGTIAGDYDPDRFELSNFGFREIHDDFVAFLKIVRAWNPKFKVILTVSPVPLTATATTDHVLVATTYSKSVLRSAAGALAREHDFIDYFPSYEMIASPWSKGFFYEANMRSVNRGGVEAVMRIFFQQHGTPAKTASAKPATREERLAMREERAQARKGKAQQSEEDAVCEDILLEAFGP